LIDGYLCDYVSTYHATPVIPPKANRKTPQDFDHWRCRKRHLVEYFMHKIKHYRRIFSQLDKLAKRYLGFLSFISALNGLRQMSTHSGLTPPFPMLISFLTAACLGRP
jgi:transposase